MSAKLIVRSRTTDTGLDKLRLSIEHLQATPSVKVGFVGAKASEDHGGITVGELGAVHEYGSPKQGIPERSFIRSTLDRKRALITRELGKGLTGVLEGTTTGLQVVMNLGEKIAKEIQLTIDRGLEPPLKRGPAFKPLIDTGKLISAISYEVTINGQVVT